MITMRAVRIHHHGRTETLTDEDTLRPEPSTDEVLIRVRAEGF